MRRRRTGWLLVTAAIAMMSVWLGMRWTHGVTAQTARTTAPQVAIDFEGDDVLLTWGAVPEAVSYNVYRSQLPYFEPTDVYAVTITGAYTDTDAMSESHAWYYVVTAVDGSSSESEPSNRVGIFAIPVLPGWNLLAWPLLPVDTTLDAVLGDQLYGTDNPETADRVLVWDSVAQYYDSAWYCGGACEDWGAEWANHWLAGDYSQSTLTLEADTGFWIENRSGVTEQLVVAGDVAASARSVPTDAGWQLLGSAFALSKPLDYAGLPAVGTHDPETADRVLMWDAALQSYESAWYCGGPECESWGPEYANHWLSLDYSQSELALLPGHGFWLENRHSSTMWSNAVPAPDLGIAAADGNHIVTTTLPDIAYTLSFSNTGGQGASGTTITATLPAGTTFNAALSAAGWQPVALDATTSVTYTYDAGLVAVGITDVVTLGVTVDDPASQVGTYLVLAVATVDDGAAGLDPSPDSNSSRAETPASSGPTNVCGTVDGVWDVFSSPYIVTCDLTVAMSTTLTVIEGAAVKFDTSGRMLVNGELQAFGDTANEVVFTSVADDSVGGDTNGDGSNSQPGPGNWYGVIASYGGTVTIDYADIRYGGGDNLGVKYGAVMASSGELTVSNSDFSHNRYAATTRGYDSSLQMTDNTITNSPSYAVYADAGMVTLTGNQFIDGYYGVYLRDNGYLTPTLTSNAFLNNTDAAVGLEFRHSLDQLGMSTFPLTFSSNSTVSGNGTNGLLLHGVIFKDTVMSPSDDLTYVIDSDDLTIQDGATMTIEPGVVLKFISAYDGSRLNVYGTLNIAGTASEPVVLTSIRDDSVGGDTNGDGSNSQPGPGNWYGVIASYGGTVTIDYADIRYGGGDNLGVKYGAVMASSGELTVSNSDFSHNRYAATTRGYDSSLQMTDNTITNSPSYAVYADAGMVTLTGNQFIDGYYGVYLRDNGYLTPTLTSNAFLNNTDAAVGLEFRHSLDQLGMSTFPLTFSSNSTVSGNGTNGLLLHGVIFKDTVMSPSDDLTYVIDSDDLTIQDGATMTIEPGVVLKFISAYDGSRLNVYGTLNIAGTASEPVVLTSIRDDSVGGDTNGDGSNSQPGPGNWYGVIASYGGTVTIDYADIRYGGGDNLGVKYGAVMASSGELTVSNSDFSHNRYAATTRGYDSSLQMTDNTITNSPSYAVYADAGMVTLTGNQFIDGYYGVYLRDNGYLTPTLTSNAFLNNTDAAVGLEFSHSLDQLGMSTFPLTFSSNSTVSGNGTNGLLLHGVIFKDTVMSPSDDLTYVIDSDDLTIQDGATMTIEPGVVLKFINAYDGSRLNVYGTLNIAGTAGEPVVLTSSLDDSVGGDTNGDGSNSQPGPGNWYGVIASYGGTVTIDYADIRYGGGDNLGVKYGAVMASSGELTVSNSDFSHNRYAATTRGYDSSLQMTDNTITNSPSYAVYADAGMVTLTGNQFIDGYYGVYLRDNGYLTPTLTSNAFLNNTDAAVGLEFRHSLDQLGMSTFPLTFSSNSTVSGNGTNGLLLHGVIFKDTVMSPSDDLTYVIDSDDLTIQDGATMTIEPGVVLKFINAYDGSRLNVYGTLNIAGTAGEPVVLTSSLDDSVGGDTNGDGSNSQPGPGNWYGVIASYGGTVTIDYADIRYGGGDNLGVKYGAVMASSGELTVSNSDFSHNRYAATTRGYDSSLQMTDNTITNSPSYAVYADAGMVTLTGNQFIDGYYGVYLRDNGYLTPTLTSNAFLNNTDAAVGLEFRHSLDQLGMSTFPLTFSSNSTVSGNGTNGLLLHGVIFKDTVMSPSDDLTYVIDSDDLTIQDGATMTIEPGVVLKFINAYDGSRLNVYGTLNIAGTASEPVVLTSIRDDSVSGDTNGDGSDSQPIPGDWFGVIASYGGTVTIDHADIRYGGISYSGNEFGAVTANNGTLVVNNSTFNHNRYAATTLGTDGDLVITNCVMQDGDSSGVFASGGSLFVSGTRIESNYYGVYIESINELSLHNNSFISNQYYAIYNADTSTSVNAENNWWGSDSGPAPYGSGNGINYASHYDYDCGCMIIDQYYVDATPWLGQQSSHGGSVPWQYYEADPVNTANGNYTYSRTDLSIPTRSLPLQLTRAYNATAPVDGPLGYGWTFSYNVYLEESTTDGSVTITHGDGRTERFTWDGAAYVSPAGTLSKLVKTGSEFDLTSKDQTIYHFNSNGRLVTITDSNDNVTTLSYPGTLVTSVIAPDGRALTFSYDGDSRLSSVSDPAGRSVEYGYTLNGDLGVVTDTTGITTTYTYDADHQLLTITDGNGHTFLDNTYNSDGRVIEQRDADSNLTTFVYDIPNHRTTVTNPRSHATVYQYDADLRLLNITDASGEVESYTYDSANNRIAVTDKRGYTTGYAYDAQGNTIAITDTLNFTSTYAYDSYNNLLSMVDGNNETTHYEYDATHNLVVMTDTVGAVTSYSYDSFGQLTGTTDPENHTTEFAYDAYGHVSVMTDTMGYTSVYTYDVAGRLLFEEDALGRVITRTYDAANRVLTVADPLGGVTTTTYDAVGNPVMVTDAESNTTTYVYDAKDRLVNTIDALGQVMTYTYDAVNNQTATIDPLGHVTSYTYDELNRRETMTDALGNTTTYSYDENGNRVAVTDAKGKTTHFTYDERNQLVTTTDALGGSVTFTYDGNGNRLSLTDANNHTTSYVYDAANRLLAVTDPLTQTVQYGYDGNGNRTSTLKADGTLVSYTYDALNRLETTTYPGGSISYEYDAIGNRTVMTDTLGVTTYSYDALDRPQSVTDSNGMTLQYEYDGNGNRTGITYPDSKTVSYTYDDLNRLDTVTDWDSAVTDYTYDAAGRQTDITYPNNTQAIYHYDDANRLLNITHSSTVSGTIGVFSYTVDAVGNRTVMTDTEGVTTYNYDDLYRLTAVTYPDGETVSYAYDPMGNRTEMTSTVSGVTTYLYDAGDRLLTYTETIGTTNLTWDANGNLQSKGGVVYTFDPLDRMTQVVSGTQTVDFDYNGDGVRLGKTTNGIATTYVQDVAAPLPLVLQETTSGQTDHYLYGNDLIATEDPSSSQAFYHADGLGSVRALSNETGQQTDSYSYDVFGTLRNHTGFTDSTFGFTGEQHDDEVGLIFLRARYYDSEIGRLSSSDPFPSFEISSQGYNRYVYVVNSPANFTDSTGMSRLIDELQLATESIGAYLSQYYRDENQIYVRSDPNFDNVFDYENSPNWVEDPIWDKAHPGAIVCYRERTQFSDPTSWLGTGQICFSHNGFENGKAERSTDLVGTHGSGPPLLAAFSNPVAGVIHIGSDFLPHLYRSYLSEYVSTIRDYATDYLRSRFVAPFTVTIKINDCVDELSEGGK